jgi:copper homeostasis protein
MAIKKEIDVPVMCMVRPREGGMAYGPGEFTAMLRDTELFLDAGADGLVFGFLTSDGQVDVARCREFLNVVRDCGKGRPVQTVFHRAFDVVADPRVGLEQLIDLGVTRVLTSGRAPTALQGLAEIRRTSVQADGRIQVMPGAGIDRDSVERVVQETGVDQVHLYVTRIKHDTSVSRNEAVYFGAHIPQSEKELQVVDEEEVRRIRATLDKIQ